MPTVLDLLKKHLLGDEVADRLEQALASWNAMTAPTSVTPVSDRADLQWSADMQTDKPIPIFEALRTPSPGYEPLLMEAGWGQLAARGMAKLAVGHGKRRAKESTWYRPVFDAIRFLAKRPRQRRAILRCARLLLNAWNETSIIETIFDEAGVNETEFIRLLEDVMEGRQADLHHITEIARMISSHLSLPRGPKVSTASAAHEFLLNPEIELPRKWRPAAYRNRTAEYVNALTVATRVEFGLPDFDPRPAHRRRKALPRSKAIAK